MGRRLDPLLHPVAARERRRDRREARDAPTHDRVMDWFRHHPESVHGNPQRLVARAEHAVRRHAREDAWAEARDYVEELIYEFALVFSDRRVPDEEPPPREKAIDVLTDTIENVNAVKVAKEEKKRSNLNRSLCLNSVSVLMRLIFAQAQQASQVKTARYLLVFYQRFRRHR